MASQEVDRTEPGAACAGDAPGSQWGAAGEDSSAYRPLGSSQNHPEVLQVLGAVQILNAAVILALGAFIHSLTNFSQPTGYFFFSIVYTGYSTWGAIFFLVSGILAFSAGKKPTKTLLESSFGMHIASATNAVVGTVFLSMNLFANKPLLKGCQSSQPPDLCIYMEASSSGLVSLMLVLTLLELCIACSVAVLWLKANCCHLRKGESRQGPLFSLPSAAAGPRKAFLNEKQSS
ncbi:membrane-spanning 4-domains subfamily A member 3 [Muntiacus reevesi]|uniref:membrane-spanning 4-domains subfamily A member 3 n=1 Tax=Muntiacus reevesi TaxID=9886 RepID=UPI003307C02E